METFWAILVCIVLVPLLIEFLLQALAVLLAIVALAGAGACLAVEWVVGLFRKKEDRFKWVWLGGPDAK
jgi:hypothetical protein